MKLALMYTAPWAQVYLVLSALKNWNFSQNVGGWASLAAGPTAVMLLLAMPQILVVL